MPKPIVLILDDERNTRIGLEKAFSFKYEIILAESADLGIQILKEKKVDVVLTDLRMPGIDGMEFTKMISSQKNAPLIIMLTAYGSVQTAIQAMKVGAYDYLTKPINLDNLEMVIDRGLESIRASLENDELRKKLDADKGGSIIGQSTAIKRIFESIAQVSMVKSTVLIAGESGTGKELVAKAIHNASDRAKKPFVTVHCAALSANLLESELFGHEKGSFTGAYEQSVGRFERADGGTLFLDEIGEIDSMTQIKLLRVLESRRFERVGGDKVIEVDVRLIAATNRNLKNEVEKGNFREDLYYRLNVVNIHLPALRERGDDIMLLLDYYLHITNQECGTNIQGFNEEALKILRTYKWQGNVRELRNCVERMVVMAKGSTLTMQDVPLDIQQAVSANFIANGENSATSAEDFNTIDSQEKQLIIRALRELNGNRTKAAKKLGISRRTLYRKLDLYDIE